MNNNFRLFHRQSIILLTIGILFFSNYYNVFAQDKNLVVRIAKLQIDSVQLESYNAALKEEIETAVRVEPGVLTLYAVAEESNPASIFIMEIYANQEAYLSHLETPHFKKYKNLTKDMVISLELIPSVPLILETKNNQK